MDPKAPTLDQIAVFLAIVETGSFAGAARKLGRAPSVISYAIANLESQLGVSLFARAGTARPTLTEAGRAVLPDCPRPCHGAGWFDRQGARPHPGAGSGSRAGGRCDAARPQAGPRAGRFSQNFSHCGTALKVEALGAVTQAVLGGGAAFGLSGPLELANDLLARGPAGSVKLLAVAAPDHPLACVQGPVSAVMARDHIQLVLTDRSSLTEGRDFGVMSVKTWRLADLGAKHALLLAAWDGATCQSP